MKRHPLDAPSLVFGLLFVALGVAALADGIDFELLTLDWLWPAVLIGSGIAVLLTLGSRETAPDVQEGDQVRHPDEDPDVLDAADRDPADGR